MDSKHILQRTRNFSDSRIKLSGIFVRINVEITMIILLFKTGIRLNDCFLAICCFDVCEIDFVRVFEAHLFVEIR